MLTYRTRSRSVKDMSQGLYLTRRPYVDFGRVVSSQCR